MRPKDITEGERNECRDKVLLQEDLWKQEKGPLRDAALVQALLNLREEESGKGTMTSQKNEKVSTQGEKQKGKHACLTPRSCSAFSESK